MLCVLRQMADEYNRRRKLVLGRIREMSGISCTEPKGAFYIFPSIRKTGMNSFDFCMYLLEKGRVSTVPGSAFGNKGEGFFRISYATSMSNLKEGLDRLENVLNEMK